MGVRKKIKKAVKDFLVWKNRKKFFLFFKENVKNSFNLKRKIGFFTPLPPAQTGTAEYALKTYSALLNDLDFISDFKTLEEYKETLNRISEEYKNHVVVQDFLEQTQKTYDHIILNLGNSYFHIPYLKYGIQTKGKENRHIVLCETQIFDMLQQYYKNKKIEVKDVLKKYYPEKNCILNHTDFREALKRENIYGIRPLIDLTGIRHFIVYRENGKEMLLADLKGSSFENDIKISVIPMGFEQITPPSPSVPLETNGYNIGSFGIAHDMKQTNKIIDAVNLLNKQGNKITLWLVGYHVSSYVQPFDLSYVRVIENAEYDEMLSLMASVDLAVQLRKFSNGEGSGCLSELIALNKNFIAADNLFEPHFKEAGVSIPSDCSVEDLAAVILTELKNKTVRDNKKILETYTFKNTAEKFMEALR